MRTVMSHIGNAIAGTGIMTLLISMAGADSLGIAKFAGIASAALMMTVVGYVIADNN